MSSSKHASLAFLYCLSYSTAASITSSCLAPPLAAAAYASSAFRPNSLCSYMSLHLSEQEQVQDQEGASAAHRVPAAEPSNRHRHALSYYVLGEARTILLRHIINASPSKQASYGTYLPQGIYGARLLFCFCENKSKTSSSSWRSENRSLPGTAELCTESPHAHAPCTLARTHRCHWARIVCGTSHRDCSTTPLALTAIPTAASAQHRHDIRYIYFVF